MTWRFFNILWSWEENSKHFKQYQNSLIKVRWSVFKCLSIQIVNERLLTVFKANKLVRLEVLEVADGEEFLLCRYLWQIFGIRGARDCRKKLVLGWISFLLFIFTHFILEPSEYEVERHSRLVTSVEFILNILLGNHPVRPRMLFHHLSFNFPLFNKSSKCFRWRQKIFITTFLF